MDRGGDNMGMLAAVINALASGLFERNGMDVVMSAILWLGVAGSLIFRRRAL